MFNQIFSKIRRRLIKELKFDSTGERVDILYKGKIDFQKLDIFQKSHFNRYQYALEKVEKDDICGDFACGTGYGSVMLAKKTKQVIGVDLNTEVINAIQKRYKKIPNVQFLNENLLSISFNAFFDKIISFETIEHFTEENICELLIVYNRCLKPGGEIIISTPYLQERDDAALKLGHHLTFYIDEKVLTNWLLKTNFKVLEFKYQNYDTHAIADTLERKDFIICLAQKR